jgi:Arc/MetJ-type ribon-helix-helix transcriptional regulator
VPVLLQPFLSHLRILHILEFTSSVCFYILLMHEDTAIVKTKGGGMRDDRELERVVRIVLPIKLIRQMDEALQESLGGFETRAEFVREAVENMLIELKYEPAQPELPVPLKEYGSVFRDRETERVLLQRHVSQKHDPEEASVYLNVLDGTRPKQRDDSIIDSSSLALTVLRAPPSGSVVEDGVAWVENEPLFGLHNRDYPSIWAAHQLAELARSEPILLSDYLDEVTRRAWLYADTLRPLEHELNRKLTIMFPRNLRKPQSADEGFRTFAIGSVNNRGGDERPTASGPLFAWKVCQLRSNGRLLVGLTGQGYKLLRALDGISLDLPHPPEMAEHFFAHLREYARGDWWGFETVLKAVAEEPDRNALLAHFRAAQPDWSNAVVGTNSQGYVGRAREWGLIEPKQIQGRYLLTDFGRRILKGGK